LLGSPRAASLKIAVFESVQQAVNRPDGYQLMRRLRETLEERSGLSYHLYHVKHDAYSLGGAAVRKRYFWVVSQIPFGIDPPKPQRVPLLRDVISDLEGLDMTWHSQPVRRPPSWWAEDKVRGTVDGHHPSRETPHRERVYSFVRAGWTPRETMSEIARRYYLEHGKLPIEWQPYEEKLLANDFDMGFRGPWRWSYDRASRVITGGALDAIIHPVEDRFLTHREAARVMGFPDDWNLYPLRHVRGLETNHGKGITVQCGSWIASWVKAALDGNPSDFIGEETGEREHTLNFTRAHWPISSER
jgi:site-specific DNA-cytosine methylase